MTVYKKTAACNNSAAPNPTPRDSRRVLRLSPVVGCCLLLGACASLPPERGLDQVNQLLQERTPGLQLQAPGDDRSALRARVDEILSRALTPESAISLALANNPQMRIIYADLGLAQAQWLGASSPANPELEFSPLFPDVSGEMVRLGYRLVQNLTDLIYLAPRQRAAEHGLAQAQAEAAAAVQALAMDTAAAYFNALGASQLEQMAQLRLQAARTQAQLAQRFQDAGNLNALESALEQAAAKQAELDYAAAQAEALTSRAALNALLGLPPLQAWQLAEALPLPVEHETSLDELVQLSLRQRLDLQAQQAHLRALEERLGVAESARWLPYLGLGLEGERESDGTHFLGPTLSVELPIFGQSRANALEAQAEYERACAEADLLTGQIGNAVVAAQARMEAARQRVAGHRQGLLPQLEAIVARTQEMQNFMLIGQFELLQAKQQEFEGYSGYLEALRDYWLARVELTRSVGAVLPGEGEIGPATEAPIRLPDEAPPSMHHGHHAGQHGE